MADARLPDGLQGDLAPLDALLNELAGDGVRIVFHRAEKSPRTGHGLDFATTEEYREHAEVFYPEGSKAHQVYHELLHIKRNYASKVRALVACPGADADTKRNLMELDNFLEHAFVVPEEIAAYPKAAPYWERDFNKGLAQVPWTMATDTDLIFAQKVVLFEGWLVLPHAPALATVAHAYRGRLEERGWLAAADAMTEAVQRAGLDKKAAVQALWRALGYPPPMLCCYEAMGQAH